MEGVRFRVWCVGCRVWGVGEVMGTNMQNGDELIDADVSRFHPPQHHAKSGGNWSSRQKWPELELLFSSLW